MTEAAKNDPLKPLPNGVVPHPKDFVLNINGITPNGVAAGYLRVRATDGEVETFGWDPASVEIWTKLEEINPAIVKLCRNQFELVRKINHVRRELLNSQEASARAVDVLANRRPANP